MNASHLIRGLSSLKEEPYTFGSLNLTHEEVLCYGDLFLISFMWDFLGMEKIIGKALGGSKVEFDVGEAALLMVANRCIDPESKLKVWEWQERIWLEGLERLDYHKILRALEHLEKIKDEVEEGLFQTQLSLFTQRVDLVFYDVTSSYFEGNDPSIAKKGHSSDKRPDCPMDPADNQILLALALTKEGIPIGHEVYEGNRKDSTTVIGLVEKLKSRFCIERCIFVGDGGMVSPQNIEKLKELNYDYIFALRKRRLKEKKKLLGVDLKGYEKIVEKRKGEERIKLWYKEIVKDGRRYIVCYNPGMAEQDRERLELRKGEKETQIRMILEHHRDAGVIIKHIAKITDVDRYFKYRLKKGRVVWEEHKESLDYERLIAGKWILKTEDFSLSTLELIETYKNLSEVERAFRTMKSFLDLRPIYHRDERRVKGHVFICVLAYYLQKVTEKLLTDAGLELSGLGAIEKLSEIKLIKSRLNGKRILQATPPKKEHKAILTALGISYIPPARMSAYACSCGSFFS